MAALGLALARYSSAQFVLFPVTEAFDEPRGVCFGPDQNVWFTVGNQVGRITPAGVVTRFSVPTLNAGPGDIVTGPDGNLWFLEVNAKKVGRVSQAGAVSEFPIPGPSTSPVTIAVGPDGAIWFSDFIRLSIWRISLSGVLTEYPVPSAAPYGLATGSDGNLWFTGFGVPSPIGRMAVSGAVTLFSRPSSNSGWKCALGPDGNIWYTVVGRAFGRVTPSGVITEFPFTADRGHMATSIAVGTDGNLWMPVDETFQCVLPCDPSLEMDGVLRTSTDGRQTRYELSTDLQISDGSKITVGPDGSMWFTARRGLVRFFPAQLAQPESIPVTGVRGQLILFGLLLLVGLALLLR